MSQYGHLIATAKLAHRLKNDGFRVCYLLTESVFENWVRMHGFEAFTVSLAVNLEQVATRLLGELKPAFCLFDMFRASWALALLERPVSPAIIYHTVRDSESAAAFRQTPLIKPKTRWRRAAPRLSARLDWLSVWHWKLFCDRLFRPGYFRAETAGVSKMKQLGIERLKSSMRFDIPAMPEIVLGPYALSYRNECEQRYLGLCMDEGAASFDRAEEVRIAKLNTKGRKVVFVSFGTRSANYSRRHGRPCARELMLKILNAFRDSDRYFLIVLTRDRLEYRDFEEVENIRFFERLDQKKVLASVDAMIGHGGFGAIKECVYHQVPMVIAPFLPEQLGNASMVEEQGLGVRVDTRRATSERLAEAVDRAVADASIRTRMAAMRAYEDSGVEFERGYAHLLALAGVGSVPVTRPSQAPLAR